MGAGHKVRTFFLMLCFLLSACQSSRQILSPEDVANAEAFLSGFELATLRNSAKPLEQPVTLLLRQTNGPIKFRQVERGTVGGRLDSLQNSDISINIKGIDPLTVTFDLEAIQGNSRFGVWIEGPFSERGIKLGNLSVVSNQFRGMNEAQKNVVKSTIDKMSAMFFMSAGRTISKRGDELYTMDLAGMIPGASGIFRVDVVGESNWLGRSVLVGESRGNATISDGSGTRLNLSMTIIEVIDQKSSLTLAFDGIGEILLPQKGRAVVTMRKRIEEASVHNLP